MTATRTRPTRSERPVDPRMQARRQNVARQEGRRRLWLVAGLTLITTLAITVIAASRSSLFDVERVDVVGADRADREQIAAASGIQIGQPLVEVHPSSVVAGVATVPWVERAVVHRHLGGGVTIVVTERVAVAVVPAAGRFALVDGTGQQVEAADSPPPGLLVIQGTEASGVPGESVPDEAAAAVSLIRQLSPPVAAQATGVVLDQGHLMVLLSSGGRADFGDIRALDTKMVALETVLARVDLSCVAMIDVRVADAPTVRRNPAKPASKSASKAGSQEPLAGSGGC